MKKLMSGFLALALGLSLAACGGSTTASSAPASSAPADSAPASSAPAADAAAPAEDDGPIVIGFMGWSSGPDAMYGLVPQYTLENYFKHVNAEGGWLGREIDLRTYDISGLDGDFSEAVNVANKLIAAGVDVIIGPSNSTQGAAVAELCNNAGVLHLPIGTATSVTVDDNGNVRPWTFRVANHLNSNMDATATYAYEKLGAPRIAILYETTQIDCVEMYERFQAVYEHLGGEIVDTATYQINDIEFRAQIEKMAESDPDYIFMPAMGYKEVAFLAQQLHELGHGDIHILTGEVDNQECADLGGEALEGIRITTEVDLSNPDFADMIAEYNENYGNTGMAMNLCGPLAMDQALTAKYAIETAGGTDPEKMREALENVDDLELFTSHINGWDDMHKITGKEIAVKTYEDGKFVTIDHVEVPDVDLD